MPCVPCCLALWLVAAQTAAKELAIVTGELTVTMEAQSSWTIRSVQYQGTQVIIPAGGQGAVLMPKGGQWVGSAMRPEVTEPVKSLEVLADGVAVTLAGASQVKGEKVIVRKQSQLGGFEHSAETTFEKDRIVQKHAFAATEDMQLQNFYAFIYSFTTAGRTWAAQPLDGALRTGAFKGEGHVPGATCEWMAQYDAASQKGALVYFQTPFAGPGALTAYWDTKSYHKLFAQPFSGSVKKGARSEHTMVMRFFGAPADGWEQAAQRLADDLKKEFPPVKRPAEAPKGRGYGAGVPEAGDLTCETAHYTVLFEARPAWTIRRIDFDGKTIASPSGWYGTVMVPKGGQWWGTGHTEGGAEIVHSLALSVDGQSRPVAAGAAVEGSKITLLKKSTIWKFTANVEVTVTDDLIYERAELAAIEDCELNLLYYYMHCFVPSTTAWAAELPDGSFETGALDHSKGFSVNKNTRWVAEYEPSMGLGILCYTPKVIAGRGSLSKIWNQPHYHKLYLQQNAGQAFKAGDKLDFAVIVKAVPGETEGWEKTKAAAAALKKLYPPAD